MPFLRRLNFLCLIYLIIGFFYFLREFDASHLSCVAITGDGEDAEDRETIITHDETSAEKIDL